MTGGVRRSACDKCPEQRTAPRRRRGRRYVANASRAFVFTVFSIVTEMAVLASALQCFSCADCSVGGALSAHIEQCPPEENCCAVVSRPRTSRWGYQSSSVDRGCASSLHLECEPLDATPEMASAADHSKGNRQLHGDSRDADSQQSAPGDENIGGPGGSKSAGGPLQRSLCCSTDLCNGLEDPRTEGHRRSEEYLRFLMEGNPRKSGNHPPGTSFGGGGGGAAASGGGDLGVGTVAMTAAAGGEDDSSAQSTRGGVVGGSRFATVLVIVGTFSQVLWLLSSLIE